MNQGEARREGEIYEYLRGLDLPTVPEELEQLEVPIIPEVVRRVINSMALGKSPGPDGYSILYYKRFQKFPIPKLCEYLNALAEGETLREESLLAYILLILKEGKDPTVPASYRPISLLNTDIKIFAKVIVERLKPLPSWFNSDQVGVCTRERGKRQ